MLSVTLRKLIDQKLTTAREIGELTGTAPSTVYRWIRGEAQPSFDTIRLLMRHLRDREAQAALLGTFTASTPWRFYTMEADAEANVDTLDLRDVVESTLDTMRGAAQAIGELRDATRDRALTDAEADQFMQQVNQVMRQSAIAQRVITTRSERRQPGQPGQPQPQRLKGTP